MAHGSVRARRAGAPGFTLVELLFVIALIFLLMGLLLGGIRYATRTAKGASDRATASALKSGVSQFAQSFSIAPPMVKDGHVPVFNPVGPLNPPAPPGPNQVPVIYSPGVPAELTFLRFAENGTSSPGAGVRDMRFSLYSLSYYVLGALDSDGQPGPGFRSPKRDGSFEKSGRTFNPFFDVSKNAHAAVETIPGSGRIELRDSRGVGIRYYRWKTGWLYPSGSYEVNKLADLNVPWIVGDASVNADLKNADYAIVLAGPNGLFGDEYLLTPALPPPAGHPQYLSGAEFMSKLGRSGSVVGPLDREAAMADNIVVVGVEANR